MATSEESEGSGAEDDPGVAADGRGATATATSTNKAGAGGRHGARSGERERVASRQENPAGESSGVGGKGGGGAKPTEWLANPPE